MNNLQINSNPEVEQVFGKYPKSVLNKMLHLRKLIIETAEEIEEIKVLEETLKWGEPSYLVKKGSTIRIDWKKNYPDQYAVYFSCLTKLVPTFKIVYRDIFRFEGNRAIIFQLDDKLPVTELKKCISIALTYHKIKHLPFLGL